MYVCVSVGLTEVRPASILDGSNFAFLYAFHSHVHMLYSGAE